MPSETVVFSAKDREADAIWRAANERGITVSSLIYALVYSATSGFQDFSHVPDPLPRPAKVQRRKIIVGVE